MSRIAVFAVLSLWFVASSSAQFNGEQQAQLDSMNRIIESGTGHDTTLASVYVEVSGLLYQVNPDTLKYLNELALDIIEKGLSKNPGSAVENSLMNSQSGALNNLGVQAHASGDIEAALDYHQRSMQLKKDLGNERGVAVSLNNIGYMYFLQGKVEQCVENWTEAVEFFERSGDTSGMIVVYNNIGNVFHNQKDYNSAIKFFKLSNEIALAADDFFHQAKTLNNMGACYLQLDSLYLSLSIFRKSLEISENIDDKPGISISQHNIGNSYLMIGIQHREDGSLSNDSLNSLFQLSFDYLSSSLERRKELGLTLEIPKSMLAISKAQFNMGNNADALRMGSEAYQLAKDNGDAVTIQGTAEILSQIHEALGNDGKAYAFYKEFIEMRDSINNRDTQQAAAKQEASYEYRLRSERDSIQNAEAQKVKDAEIAKQDAEIEAKKKEQFLLFGGLGLVVVFALFIFNRFRVTNQQKKIISSQKDEVEKQREAANEQRKAAELQKELVEEKNKEIIDSINYARRLQEAILPPQKLVKEYLPDSFILYQPKDIVAGDFYWFDSVPNGTSSNDDGYTIYFAAADCTGHGVPGAMVSVVCSNALTKVLLEEKITEPGKMLDRTRELVIDQFARSEEEVKDGMDISLCALNLKTRELQWAGANNPLWVVRSQRHSGRPFGDPESAGTKDTLPIQPIPDRASLVRDDGEFELFEVKADKQPIGKYAGEKPFYTHSFQLNEGDSIYIFSDGYPDQFGGEKGKKYKSGKFKKFILSIVDKLHSEQRQLLLDEFENWRGDIEQIDDVCVVGVRV